MCGLWKKVLWQASDWTFDSTDDTVRYFMGITSRTHSTTFDMVFIYKSGVNLSHCLFRQKTWQWKTSWRGVKCEIISGDLFNAINYIGMGCENLLDWSWVELYAEIFRHYRFCVYTTAPTPYFFLRNHELFHV